MSLKRSFFTAKSRTVKTEVDQVFQELMHNERLSPSALVSCQDQMVQEIVSFAMEKSPYYREIYQARGVRSDRIAEKSEWEKLPILDRSAVKENSERIPTSDATPSNIREALTGGSTGEPLRTMHDARIPTLPLSWRMYSWWGVKPYDNLARIGRWNFDKFATLKNSISWWPSRQIYLDAGLISGETMQTFHRQLNRVRPRLLEGYVGAMLEFADFLERRELTIPVPTAVATTAAPLSAPVRARLEAAFGAPVYDEYRSSEFGWMAGECGERDGLHIFADVLRIEILDNDGLTAAPGEVGDIVITDLRNRVFPMIRYRTGDRGILREGLCRCGRALPLMEQPQGRATDMIRLPSGAILAHRLMAMFAAHPEAVRLFQIHQLDDYSITIRVVEGDTADARTHIENAVSGLRQRIQNEVSVRVEYLGALPYTGGKTKYIISDVPNP